MAVLHATWFQALAATAAVSVLYSLYELAKATSRSEDFPPGPPTTWGLGNLHQVPVDRPFLQFHEWKKTYGDIIGLKLGHQNLVVLQSAEQVRELFDKRGSIYSDRTQPWIPSRLIRPGGMLWVNYGSTIRRMRTALQNHFFRPTELRRILRLQETQSAILVRRILEQPAEFEAHMRHWALATPLLTIAGHKLDGLSADEAAGVTAHYFDVQKRWVKFLEPSTAPPVEFFPFLKYVPAFMAKWKRDALVVKEEFARLGRELFDGAKSQRANIAKGLDSYDHESLMAKTMRGSEELEDVKFDDQEIFSLGSGVLDASVDTLISTTQSLVLVFAAYPEVQKKVQAELDAIREDEAPRPEDLPKLKYLKACFWEVSKCLSRTMVTVTCCATDSEGQSLTDLQIMRWRPAAPQGVPHALARDDTYGDFRFPKGTTFIINAWSIHHDEEWYDDPSSFRPERYLDNPLGVKPSMLARAEREGRRPTWNFGSGRRICPGAEYAENQVLLTVAKLAWAFDMTARGPGPVDTSIETGYNSGMIVMPESCPVNFVPRSEVKTQAVLRDFESARNELADMAS